MAAAALASAALSKRGGGGDKRRWGRAVGAVLCVMGTHGGVALCWGMQRADEAAPECGDCGRARGARRGAEGV